GGDAGWVNTGAGNRNGPAVNIRGKDLDLEILLERFLPLGEQDGDRIGFFTGGTAGHPNAYSGCRRLAHKKPRDGLSLKRGERFRVAGKPGDADQQFAKERIHLSRTLLQIAHVLVQLGDLLDGHAPRNPAGNRVLLVLSKVMPSLGAEQDTDLF